MRHVEDGLSEDAHRCQAVQPNRSACKQGWKSRWIVGWGFQLTKSLTSDCVGLSSDSCMIWDPQSGEHISRTYERERAPVAKSPPTGALYPPRELLSAHRCASKVSIDQSGQEPQPWLASPYFICFRLVSGIPASAHMNRQSGLN